MGCGLENQGKETHQMSIQEMLSRIGQHHREPIRAMMRRHERVLDLQAIVSAIK